MKRKGNNANRQDFLHKRPALRRILHASGIHHGDFTALSNVKGSATEKLSQLLLKLINNSLRKYKGN